MQDILSTRSKKIKRIINRLKEDSILYFLIIPCILYFIIFHYIPLIGMKLAFQDYRIIGDNIWVGLKHFKVLFKSPAFFKVLKNTIIISSMKMFIFFPVPIVLSLLINEIRSSKYRKYVQSVIYLPHFLSWVVIAGIWISLLSTNNGAVNQIIKIFNGTPVDFMTSKEHIRWVLLYSEMWRSAGWDSIIYLAAITKISYSLYEAAMVEGASRWQQTIYITLPELRPTIVTVFILNLGFFMNAGFDQVYNMMNDSVISVVDILDTYVYRVGLANGQYAYATAASLFKGVIGIILISSTHLVSKKLTGKGIW
ncbi:ABC transporter permease subunit [Wukongibacter baidiensis]|uniref:ABC transporter permease n=1 Tax=Wukongibacter baidiensis TaxID=1723361 RepID=UPI003D7F1946